MELKALLRELWQQGVELWLEQDNLRFRASKEVLTPARLSTLRERKAEIIELLRKNPSMLSGYPISHGQRAILMMSELVPNNIAYNQLAVAALTADCNIHTLRQALDFLINRHEQLRVVFELRDGDYAQSPRLTLIDPLHLTRTTTDDVIDRQLWIDTHANKAFDLKRGPLFKAALRIETVAGQSQFVLLLLAHHVIADYWTLELLLRELSQIYAALATGQEPSLPAHTLSYKEFVLAEQQYTEGEKGTSAWNYWRDQLTPLPPALDLPTDFSRPATQKFSGAEHVFTLDAKLARAIRDMARELGVTPFVAVLSSFQTLLYRYSGESLIAVGTPMLARQISGSQQLAGHFTNPAILLQEFDGGTVFADIVARNRSSVQQAMTHQQFPLQLLIDRLQPERDLSRPPLFQVAMSWNQASGAREGIGDGHLINSIINMEQRGAVYDLVLTCVDTGSEIRASLRYNTELFTRATVQRLAQHLSTLLFDVTYAPTTPVGQLNLISAAERAALLRRNQTKTDYPRNALVSTLFQHQALATPDAIAIDGCDGERTYDALETRSNQIANFLAANGVAAGGFVAVCLDRSCVLIETLVAIGKCACAYVPIDPDYPDERLIGMLEDTRPRAVVTTSAQRERLERIVIDGVKPVLLCIDELTASINDQPTDWEIPVVANAGMQPACVLFTSGSTGRPKGVLIPNRGVARLVINTRYMRFLPTDVVAHVSNVSFDAATWEIWGALLNGSRLRIVSKQQLLDQAFFGAALSSGQYSIILLTTALFNLYASHDPTLFRHLNYLLVGGEAVDPHKMRTVLKAGGPHHLLNAYGPTENSTIVTTHELKTLADDAVSVPIGKPISNTTVYILDEHRQPVPSGVPGEIFAGGDGVALGYLNQPTLTADRFVPDPFAGVEGARLYRTGDRGRWLADGSIEILGRFDDQVKIRGFRIELGEIENHIAQLDGVANAFVMVREDNVREDSADGAATTKYITAYLVPQQNPEAGIGESAFVHQIKADLRQRLPDYMIPQAFVLMPTLPLTGNGKVDKRALPAPVWQASAQFVAPRNAQETMLAALWADILGVERVGIYDNFFELGGHSLMATQLAARIQSSTQVSVTMRHLFEAPTIAELADRLSQHAAEDSLPALAAQPRPERLPLSLSQQRLWFVDQLDPGSTAYNMPAAVRIDGPLDITALKRALHSLVERHEILRTHFPDQQGKPTQVINEARDWQLEFVDLSQEAAADAQAKVLVRNLAQHAFDLTRGPLFYAQLIRLTPQRHILTLVMHHIIADGWSVEVMLSELGQLWAACRAGRDNPLPALPLQYADIALWQQQWLNSNGLKHQINYWKQQLAGAPSLLPLPTDYPRPAKQSFRGAQVSFRVEAATIHALRALSQQQGATLFMTLMTAYTILLSRYTQQSDVCVGFPISGRQYAEMAPLIGLFVNNLVVRSDLSNNPTVAELISAVRHTTLEAFGHQDVPFDMLVDALKLERSLSHTPLLQVSFALQTRGIEQQIHEQLGDNVTLIDTSWVAAKYDLNLTCYETADGGLDAVMEYATDLYQANTIERIALHWVYLLQLMVENPQQRVNHVPILSVTERQQILLDWHHTVPSELPITALVRRFELMAGRHPDNVALSLGNAHLSYHELNARANQLARLLVARGVSTGSFIGVYMERSFELIIALLGIIKAGGAYVPLDPRSPMERVTYILADSKSQLVLTTSDLAAGIANFNGATLCLDQLADLAAQDDNNPNLHIPLDSVIYIIYTSGTTGKPKGCLVTHENVSRLFSATEGDFGFDRNDVWTLFHSYAFDFSVWEIWGALIYGGRLVIVPYWVSRAPDAFYRLLIDEKVTVLNQTPSAFSQVIAIDQYASDYDQLALRYVIFGGEALDFAALRVWVEHHGLASPALINMYGITETTVHVTLYRVAEMDLIRGGSVIGRPMQDLHVHILDANGQLVPIGVLGEMYVSGPGVTKGYLDRPELTAERFLPNPFAHELPPGISHKHQRMYRSGDLARYLADGNIEYLGRIDHQVKIRGHRIELGEIEAALCNLRDVREAVVLAREDAGDKRLVAYLLNDIGDDFNVSTVRDALKKQLPEYMIPAAFVPLTEWPLTGNGKIDKAALPPPEAGQLRHSFVEPRNDTEQAIATIWCEILGIERIGIHDNFFEIGGHSLLATQVASRIRNTLNTELELRAIFENPTVAELAMQVLSQEINLSGISVQDMDSMLNDLLDEFQGSDDSL